MGYYTNHELTVNTNAHSVAEIANALKESDFYEYAFEDLKDSIFDDETRYTTFALYSYDAVKWYGHDGDMCELSEKFPSAVFILHGEGEEQGDIWETMYKGGKVVDTRKMVMVWDKDWNED